MQFNRVRRVLGTRRRAIVASIGVGALALAVATASASEAGVTGPHRPFTPVPPDETITQMPVGLANREVTLMVQMPGDPVVVTDADAPQPRSASERQAQKTRLRAQQVPVEQRVRDLGGTVLGNYQSAYNGVKVRISARKASALMDIPNVVSVHVVHAVKPDNIHGVPLIGAPAVWAGLNGFHGEGIKVAVIDTGIDYTHKDFGGPGTPAAYDAAHAAETAPANPAHFGPGAPKVKGGIDLVGDSYNADNTSPDFQPIPHPDPNPLDCNGHGSHVAGTAVGFGVLSDGSTYTGPYNDTTISGHSWNVAPGVAPKADLYGIRVFGCQGPTDVTVDAIEWAVDHDMDVINMSLGSPFGSDDDPAAVASSNAAKAGVIVVASAGNSGPNPYMVGSPSTGSGVISVAASDPNLTLPGANASINGAAPILVLNSNAVPTLPASLPIKVLRDAAGGISLGCNPADYVSQGVTGTLVITRRGTCARVARAIFGQQAGAAAVLMVNNVDSLPPFEGPITENPDDGVKFNVTIPFLGSKLSDRLKWLNGDGGTVTLAATNITNTEFKKIASFSSGGPRTGDSSLKPDVTAPGVSIQSVGMGTGNNFAVISGTSMAAPHTAGLAALVRQAHPTWKKVHNWKAAIVNTASPSEVPGFRVRASGAGFIQAIGATQTQVVALGDKNSATLNFGFAELDGNFNKVDTVTLRNFSNAAATFAVGTANASGRPHTVGLNKTTVTVPANGDAQVKVTLNVPSGTAGNSSTFNDVAGLVTFTPTSGNNGVTLRVPYYFVPQTASKVNTKIDTRQLRRTGSATATVTNKNAAGTGTADWYAWGLSDAKDKGLGSNDVRAVGVQAFPDPDPSNSFLVFAIGTQHRWSNAAQNEFDIFVDVNGDGSDDYAVVGVDLGAITAGDFNGVMVSAVFDLNNGGGFPAFFADAPKDSTTIALPVTVDMLCGDPVHCLSPANPRFTYHVVAFGLTDNTVDEVAGSAKFNAYTPSISTGMFDTVVPGGSANETVTLDVTEFAQTPALGLMIISHDNHEDNETQTIAVNVS